MDPESCALFDSVIAMEARLEKREQIVGVQLQPPSITLSLLAHILNKFPNLLHLTHYFIFTLTDYSIFTLVLKQWSQDWKP